MLKVIIATLFLISPALAESRDVYWQRLLASKEASSAQQLVDLATALDAANAKIAELMKACKPIDDKPESK